MSDVRGGNGDDGDGFCVRLWEGRGCCDDDADMFVCCPVSVGRYESAESSPDVGLEF